MYQDGALAACRIIETIAASIRWMHVKFEGFDNCQKPSDLIMDMVPKHADEIWQEAESVTKSVFRADVRRVI